MSKSRAECLRILGLSPSASEREIREAYRRKALEHHPDKNKDDEQAATERFKDIQEAYRILVGGNDEEEAEFEIYIPNFGMFFFMMMMEEQRRWMRNIRRNNFVFEEEDDEVSYDPFGGFGLGNSHGFRQREAPRSHLFQHDQREPKVSKARARSTSKSKNCEAGSGQKRAETTSTARASCSDATKKVPEHVTKKPGRSLTRQQQKQRAKKKKNKQKKKPKRRWMGSKRENEKSGTANDSEKESESLNTDSSDNDCSSEYDDDDDRSPFKNGTENFY